jgi:hypothetical protein
MNRFAVLENDNEYEHKQIQVQMTPKSPMGPRILRKDELKAPSVVYGKNLISSLAKQPQFKELEKKNTTSPPPKVDFGPYLSSSSSEEEEDFDIPLVWCLEKDHEY